MLTTPDNLLFFHLLDDEVLSLSLDLHFQVIAAAAAITGLLMKQMPYFAGSQRTMQQYKLYHS